MSEQLTLFCFSASSYQRPRFPPCLLETSSAVPDFREREIYCGLKSQETRTYNREWKDLRYQEAEKGYSHSARSLRSGMQEEGEWGLGLDDCRWQFSKVEKLMA